MVESLELKSEINDNLVYNLGRTIKYSLVLAAVSAAYLTFRDTGLIPDQSEAFFDWRFYKMDSICNYNIGIGIGSALVSKMLISNLRNTNT